MGNDTLLLLNVFKMRNLNFEFHFTWANNDPGFLMKEMTSGITQFLKVKQKMI